MARALRLEVTIGRYSTGGSAADDLIAEGAVDLGPLRDLRRDQKRDQWERPPNGGQVEGGTDREAKEIGVDPVVT